MGNPVRCGWNGWQAGQQFCFSSYGENKPVWSHDRFGMSLTILPDGRFVQIAGEHEDPYDPDFCIYNDVFVHDGKGGIEIYGYPMEVFQISIPPRSSGNGSTYWEIWDIRKHGKHVDT